MKIKNGFVLRQIASNWVVMPLSNKEVEFKGLIKLNETSVLLWKMLELGSSKEKLVTVLTNEYDVDENTARADVENFLKKLYEVGCIEEQ